MVAAREILLQQVIDLAQLYGWRCYHQRPARTKQGWRTALQGSKGYPDVVCVRHGRMVVAEIKRPGDRPTPDQWIWLEEMAGVPGIEVFLWYPRDWDEIVDVLKR